MLGNNIEGSEKTVCGTKAEVADLKFGKCAPNFREIVVAKYKCIPYCMFSLDIRVNSR